MRSRPEHPSRRPRVQEADHAVEGHTADREQRARNLLLKGGQCDVIPSKSSHSRRCNCRRRGGGLWRAFVELRRAREESQHSARSAHRNSRRRVRWPERGPGVIPPAARRGDGQITLVDHTICRSLRCSPRWLAANSTRGTSLCLRACLSRRIHFVQAQVHDIDLANRFVVLDAGPGGASRRTLRASHIVIALGSVPDYHGIPGVEEHSLGIKSIQEAAAIRNRILRSLELASWEQDRAIRRGASHVRGGRRGLHRGRRWPL